MAAVHTNTKEHSMNKHLAILPLIAVAACGQPYASEKGTTPGETTAPAASQDDVKHAAAVRKELSAAADLSSAAKNVTVTAVDGTVTLRGTVPTELERSRVEEIAEGVPATRSVDNQLETQQPR
jgi:osmotically-inducible protein OsmY